MEREPSPETNFMRPIVKLLGRVANFFWQGAKEFGANFVDTNQYPESTASDWTLDMSAWDQWDVENLRQGNINNVEDVNQVSNFYRRLHQGE